MSDHQNNEGMSSTLAQIAPEISENYAKIRRLKQPEQKFHMGNSNFTFTVPHQFNVLT